MQLQYRLCFTSADVSFFADQADLDLLAGVCHDTDPVIWDGDGTPAYLTSSGAPAGTNVTPAVAFAYFKNGCEDSIMIQPASYHLPHH